MIKHTVRFVTLALAASLLVSSAAQAMEGHRGRIVQRLQNYLQLSDDQVTAIQQVYAANADARKQLWQSLRQARLELRQLALTGGDPAAIQAKQSEIEQLMAQGLQMRVADLQSIGPILSPEQRDKFAQLGQNWPGRKGHRPPPAS
jgi:Spy/CpxP family protein refolding chaperone